MVGSIKTKDEEEVKFWWKWKHFEEAGSKLRSILLFEELEAESFFIKHGIGMQKLAQAKAL